MRKPACILFLFAFCLWAADFWQSKPSTEWSDKDIQKMLNNSPWAHPFSVSMSGPTPPVMRGASGGDAAGDLAPPPPISEGGGGRGGRGSSGAPAAPGGGDFSGGGPSATIVARWQSALPVKEALARLQHRSDAATPETDYVLILSGQLRSFLRGNPETLKKAVLEASSLSAKGKTELKPSGLEFTSGPSAISGRFTSPGEVSALFHFPRSVPYTLDDKEVEFATKLGDLSLKYKFRLKDMVFNRKLEL